MVVHVGPLGFKMSRFVILLLDVVQPVNVHCWDHIILVLRKQLRVPLISMHFAMQHFQNRVQNHGGGDHFAGVVLTSDQDGRLSVVIAF